MAHRPPASQITAADSIACCYINAQGQPQTISADTQQCLLAAMHPHQDAIPDTPLPPVLVFTQEQASVIPLPEKETYHGYLRLENTEKDQPLPQERQQHHRILRLPDGLPLGYHQLILKKGSQCWASQLIITPTRCYEPNVLLKGAKLWGVCIQLYGLRSAQNWGIGDFGDLKYFIREISLRGGAFIGINPIHALYPANPNSASPYSPSSRHWLNIAYIDVTQIAEFHQAQEAQHWWQNAATQRQLHAVRASDWVDYPAVLRLKLKALQLSFATFMQQKPQSKRLKVFRQFVKQGGKNLQLQATFDALHAHLMSQDPNLGGWPTWPEALRQVNQQAVADFCHQHPGQVEFYLWLQWIAHCQLADCHALCQQQQMPIGLYRDLAVGAAEGGAETWSHPERYCLPVSVGAPPDILGPMGQNWGLPPMDPHVMAAQAYRPFIELIRANMTCCGALRLDHVMSLLRLWWIPRGENADKGAYVHYPVDDLLAILALESQRHHCLVIGEDLGIVPPEIVDKLRNAGVYSYKVLFFEHDQDYHFRAPDHYAVQAIATITTHDLPTLRGYWQLDDLTRGSHLGLYSNAETLAQLYQDRARAKQGLLDGVHHSRYVPQKTGRLAKRTTMTPQLNRGLQRYLAESASALLGLQLEEWLDMLQPVNIPGTQDQYPNWRRKLTQTLEEIFSNPRINHLIQDLDQRRRKISAR